MDSVIGGSKQILATLTRVGILPQRRPTPLLEGQFPAIFYPYGANGWLIWWNSCLMRHFSLHSYLKQMRTIVENIGPMTTNHRNLELYSLYY